MGEDKNWGTVPFLRVLRPEPGEAVEGAVLATYSADLVVVAAALLSLAGLDDDRGSGSKVDFANAFERLKGKFRVLCQRGRLLAPPRSTLVLNLMDRFVREVPADEREMAWHPKIALVRYRAEDGAITWRIWAGSRNLTKSMAWELGVVAVSTESAGQTVPGIGKMGEVLAARAGLESLDPQRVRRELEGLQWRLPRGMRIDDFRLWNAGERREFPAAPAGIKKLIVMAPYLDGSVVAKLGAWGKDGTERILISTLPELKKLSMQAHQPLAGFSNGLRYLNVPDEEEADADTDAPGVSDEEPEARGIHAKLINAEHSRGRDLWLGSANLTQRGWLGPNAEIILSVATDPEYCAGIESFLAGQTCEVYQGQLESLEFDDPEQERLDEIRTALTASWNLRQERDDGADWLSGDFDPHDLDPALDVSVGRLNEDLHDWPHGVTRVRMSPAAAGNATELVIISLRLGEKDCRWVQVATISGFQTNDRDRAVMARFLDVRTFLSWIRSMLDDSTAGDGGGDWHTPPGPKKPPGKKGDLELWAPSLEQALKAWLRDPEQLKRVDVILTRYLGTMKKPEDEPRSDEEKEALDAISKVWPIIRRELLGARRSNGDEQA